MLVVSPAWLPAPLLIITILFIFYAVQCVLVPCITPILVCSFTVKSFLGNKISYVRMFFLFLILRQFIFSFQFHCILLQKFVDHSLPFPFLVCSRIFVLFFLFNFLFDCKVLLSVVATAVLAGWPLPFAVCSPVVHGLSFIW